MANQLESLATALADRYRLERELGQGGMATVYLAEDLKHHRQVAVKVLRSELTATLGAARFLREIEIAAGLQHPHILPLLDSGEAAGFLYYVMPFVEGQSLRDRLAREGELPTAEAVRILRDVTDALSYAHGRGVVHRDVKPDNVMLSGRHALVTDFGIAKAVSEATGRQAMTTVGVALGTPAYMAPEQAAADPHVDHRADIYAVGVMGYELLTGRPPFVGVTPQQVLAAHVTETPEPVTRHRPTVSAALADVVMRCLAKRPADRWQTADQLMAQLEAFSTPSGGMTPTSATAAVVVATDRWYGHPIRVGGLYLLAATAALGIAYFLTVRLGLPDWVLTGAAALLVAGLPIMIVTGLVERRRGQAANAGPGQPPPTAVPTWVTWRKALLGGLLAFGALGLGAAGYTAMRLLGIGPVGTLVASGALNTRDRLLVADFENRSADTTLGPSVTEAFRIDLAQSPIVSVMGSSEVSAALQRMEGDPGRRLDAATARELAVREGSKALVVGDIAPVGRGYVLSAKLLSPADGKELVALRETANDDSGILQAIDRLSKRMRERIGESLRTIRANDPLEQVTTASLPALRFYTQAIRVSNEGNEDAAIAFLEQAIAADSGFAMAYRKLAVQLSNLRIETTRMIAAATKAYQHRDRLPEVERYLATAWYFDAAVYDVEQANNAYRAVLAIQPDEGTALNNLGVNLEIARRFAEAESLYVRAIETGAVDVNYRGAVRTQMVQGKVAEARATLAQFAKAFPASPAVPALRARMAWTAGAGDSAEASFRELAGQPAPSAQVTAAEGLAALAQAQGKLAEAERQLRLVMTLREKMNLPADYLAAATELASAQVLYGREPAAALRTIDSALARHSWAAITPLDRPAPQMAVAYARAGQPARGRHLMTEYEASVPEAVRRGDPSRLLAAGLLAFGEGRAQDAIAALREYNEATGSCTTWGLADLGRAYELAGQKDSALAVYERSVSPSGLARLSADRWDLGRSLKAAGELSEGKGDRAKALEYYGRFVRLWKDADPELQPRVREVKQRMAELAGEPRR